MPRTRLSNDQRPSSYVRVWDPADSMSTVKRFRAQKARKDYFASLPLPEQFQGWCLAKPRGESWHHRLGRWVEQHREKPTRPAALELAKAYWRDKVLPVGSY